MEEFDEIIRLILAKLKEIDQAHTNLVNAARAAVAKFFQHLAQQFEQAMADFASTLAMVMAAIGKAIEQAGDPMKLHQAGEKWSKTIGATASTTGGSFDPSTLPTYDQWGGIAAEAYQRMVVPQKNALDETKVVADKVQNVLDNLATGIVTAWSGVLVAVTSFATKIFAAAVTAATGVGAPAAIGLAVGAVTEFAGLITTIFTTLGTYIGGTVLPSVRTLNQTVTDNAKFPKGAWPTTISVLNDSSYRDVEKNEPESRIKWHMKNA